MYADRHARSGLNPASLGIAVALNGGAVALLLLAQPIISVVNHDKPFVAYTVPPEPIPEPVPPPQLKQATRPTPLPRQHVDTSPPLTRSAANETAGPLTPTDPPLITLPSGPGEIGGPAMVPLAPPRAPVEVGPSLDPRYARDLQPPYPPAEQRAGRDGHVVLRVLVGVDGRVKQAEQVSATSDAFFQAARTQALAKWRFKPATRDGVPVEGWRTMAITFVLQDAD